jgi:hypothetical protein
LLGDFFRSLFSRALIQNRVFQQPVKPSRA